jgi:hypothetical protein
LVVVVMATTRFRFPITAAPTPPVTAAIALARVIAHTQTTFADAEFFTGSEKFTVKEIEVFKIAD